jgi:ferric-dicitrate binding protein FerR (iron transport regulator)
VRWLEESQDEAERWLREGLDLKARRTDELALRRIWTRVAEIDLPGVPGPRQGTARQGVVRALYLIAGMAMAGGLAVAVAILWPALRVEELPVPMATAPTLAPPAPPPVFGETDQVLVGPTTVRTGPREARTVRLKGGARVDMDAQTTLAVDAGQRPQLQRGRLRLHVPRQPSGETFTVAAGPYVIVVVGTAFEVGMNMGRVAVDVREGVVEVWRDGHMVRLPAGHSWRGPVREPPRVRRTASLAAPPPVALPPHPADRFLQAKDALAAGDTAGALEILEQLAGGTGPTAENSSYEIGRVLRYHRREPRAALSAWARYRERFPNGLLRAEADVSTIETLLALGDGRKAMAEAEGFLARHPNSERRPEMARVLARLRQSAAGANRNGNAGPARQAAAQNPEATAPRRR